MSDKKQVVKIELKPTVTLPTGQVITHVDKLVDLVVVNNALVPDNNEVNPGVNSKDLRN